MTLPRFVIGLVLILMLIGCTTHPVIPSPISPLVAHPTPHPTPIPPIVVPGNLLVNPSFELPYKPQDGVQEVNIARGWRAWYKDTPPCNPRDPDCWIPCPENCKNERGRCVNDYGCYWARPEFVPMPFNNAPYRVYSGLTTQKYFTFGRMHEAGLYQRVVTDAILPGDLLVFVIYIQTWECFSYDDCAGGRKSDLPARMNIQVGIDPMGGTSSDSPNVVWSGASESFDQYTPFVATARAQGIAVSVWLRTRVAFEFARSNNDVYADDAVLLALHGMDDNSFFPVVR